MTGLLISTILLWIAVATLTVLIVLIYRHFGLLYIGSRDRVAMTGLSVGAAAPTAPSVLLDNKLSSLQWDAPGEGRATMLVFSIPPCPLCAELIPHLNEFVEGWGQLADLVLVERDLPGLVGNPRDLPIDRRWTYSLSEGGALHDAFDVEATPFAFLVSTSGRVLAKGLVNTVRHLSGLMESALEAESGQLLLDEKIRRRLSRAGGGR